MANEPKIFDFETLKKTPAEELPSTILQYDIVELEAEDLSAYKKLRFKDDAKVNIAGKEPLPPQIDFTNCSEVILSGRDTSKIPPQKLKEGSSFYYMPRNSETNFYLNSLPPLYPNVDINRCQNVTIVSTDLKNIPDLKFKDGANINLSSCQNLPKNLDLSKCAAVSLSGCDLSTLKNMTFRENAVIDLSDCDLSQVKNITFPKGSSVILSGAQNLPENLDLSKCAAASLSGCNLSTIKNIKFKEGGSVNLSGAQNLPENLDLSDLNAVDLSGCDLSNVKSIKFKDGATVNLSKCKNLPENLDLSNLSAVSLAKCDITKINLKFKDGASVDLSQTMPVSMDELDLSNCKTVNLSNADLMFVNNNIKFKDDAQVNLSHAQNLPKMDVSNLSMVDLSGCDVSQIKNFRFKDNAEVDLRATKNLPENPDVSNCSNVWLTFNQTNDIKTGQANLVLAGIGPQNVDVSKLQNFTAAPTDHPMFNPNHVSLLSTKSFTFKNEQQYNDYKKDPNNPELPPKCQIIFADREKLKAELKEQTGEYLSSPLNTARTIRLDKALENKEKPTPAPQKAPPSQETSPLALQALNARRQNTH